ncbi:MAG: HU family DNA-binding protein [Chloroflexota bacterium]
MKYKELVRNVADGTGMTQKNVDMVIKDFFDVLRSSALQFDEAGVRIPGHGKFYWKTRKARSGRNPGTGEKIRVPEKKVLTFKGAKMI